MSQHDDDSERGAALPEATTARKATKPLAPRIILLLIAGAILLAIGLWTGGDGDRAARPAGPAALSIIQPADSAEVPSPLDITFSTDAPLRLTPAGWQADRYHLHALLDGGQVMPGALDIRALGDHRFHWRIRAVQPGAHTLRLVWARPDHRSIPEGASDEVAFQLK